jgi:hypothetical protein
MGIHRGCIPKRNRLKLLALVVITLGLFLSGCSKQDSATEGDQRRAEGKVVKAEPQLFARREANKQLRERIKELNCLYGITALTEKEESLGNILQGSVHLMPKGWS